jgi:uncharacterized protein with NRDE domain
VCVLFIAWQVRDDVPLIVAANRDEAHGRPAALASPWDDCSGVVAGRDLRAGGTWMGTGPGGRWAAVTNIRLPEWMGREMPRSRGRLVADFLCDGRTPDEHARRVARESEHYGGFNLLVGNLDALYYVSRGDPNAMRLEPGVYGLSNAYLDDPWPKLTRGGSSFRQWIESDLDEEAGLALLRDSEQAPDHLLPDTGLGLELERVLSPLFIIGKDYGTRSSTLLILREDGSGRLTERTFGPGGVEDRTVRHALPVVPEDAGPRRSG